MSTEDDRESEPVSGKTKKTKKAKRAKRAKKPNRNKAAAASGPGSGGTAKFPRHSIERALRIPRAIIEQNAGKESSEAEASAYVGVGLGGPFRVEISSAIKYGLLSRPRTGYVGITERARQAVRPQKPGDDIEALRQGVLEAPEISEVYKH